LQWLQRRAGAFWTDEDSVASSNRDKGNFSAPAASCRAARMATSGFLLWLADVEAGFDFLESALADVQGYHRSLCIFRMFTGHARTPGLVLGWITGLLPGCGVSRGGRKREETLAYLRERELVTSVYFEKTLNVRFAEGSSVPALAMWLIANTSNMRDGYRWTK